jgi:hypothetical protein
MQELRKSIDNYLICGSIEAPLSNFPNQSDLVDASQPGKLKSFLWQAGFAGIQSIIL